MTTLVSWTAIADTVAKVKEDQEKAEAQLIGKPLADSEPATVDECTIGELTLKVPGAASTKPDPVHHRHRLCGKSSPKQNHNVRQAIQERSRSSRKQIKAIPSLQRLGQQQLRPHQTSLPRRN